MEKSYPITVQNGLAFWRCIVCKGLDLISQMDVQVVQSGKWRTMGNLHGGNTRDGLTIRTPMRPDQQKGPVCRRCRHV
jgi:hypothetical protein